MQSFIKYLGLLFVLIFTTQGAFSQEKTQIKNEAKKYNHQMKSALYTLYKAGNVETFNMSSKQLRKIADEQNTKWVPYYHATYAYIMTAFLSKEKFKAEELLNQAQICIDKAKKLSPNNHEIVALQGFLYQARIGVNPQARASEYSRKAMKEYDHARFMNPDNPRPYYLIGQLLYRLPIELGGNTENACKHFQEAADRFETFKPRSEFSPNWGQAANAILLKKCK